MTKSCQGVCSIILATQSLILFLIFYCIHLFLEPMIFQLLWSIVCSFTQSLHSSNSSTCDQNSSFSFFHLFILTTGKLRKTIDTNSFCVEFYRLSSHSNLLLSVLFCESGDLNQTNTFPPTFIPTTHKRVGFFCYQIISTINI